jgi:BioD-like phosphotransacetylase family protein
MNTLLFASTSHGAGKTSLIIGLASALDKKCGYIKPFGDRLIYKRKRNWDYDSDLIINLWGLDVEPEDITMGFNHSKLRFVYTPETIGQELPKIAAEQSKNKDILFVEGGKDLCYGGSVHLDSLAIADYLKARTILLVSGEDDAMLDDIHYFKKYFYSPNMNLAGIIFNKVRDVEDFEHTHLAIIEKLGIPVLGIIPYKQQLTYFSIKYLADKFFAKVIAGEKGLDNIVKTIFVGAMSTGETLRNPLFNKENKLLITSGDRSDMIVAALESDTIGIFLTNNILPPSNIISKANEKNVPLLLTTADTYQISSQIDEVEALLTPERKDNQEFLKTLVKKYVKIDQIVK